MNFSNLVKANVAVGFLLVLGLGSATGQAQEKGMVQVAAPTEGRIALLVGNASYQYAGVLKNPINDVDEMAAVLKTAGFSVQVLRDVGLKNLVTGIDQFRSNIEHGNYETALFYYSGHGVEVDGSNYIMPVDANPMKEVDVSYTCYPAQRIIDGMNEAGAKTKLLILDACRNNPLRKSWSKSASGEGGLASMVAPEGTFIGFATSPGKEAADGNGRCSPYTASIIEHFLTPNSTILSVFTKVASSTSQKAKSQGFEQTPFLSSSLMGDFYLNRNSHASDLVPIDDRAKTSHTPPLFSLRESFSNNDRNWGIFNDSGSEMNIVNGAYRITSKAGGFWFVTIPVSIDASKNYEISATVTKLAGVEDYYFGISMGYDIVTRRYHFAAVTGMGHYGLMRMDPNASGPQFLVPSNINSVVKPGNATNHLMVKKVGNLFFLYVNESLMGTAPAESLFGDRFGFQLFSGYGYLSVDFDNLSIRQLD
jgi:hypothetical protein